MKLTSKPPATDSVKLASYHVSEGLNLAIAGDFAGVLNSHRLAADIHKRVGRQDESTARVFFFMGNCAIELQRYEDALQYFQPSLTIRRKLLPPDHPDIAKVLGCIAEVHSKLGNRPEAYAAQTASIRVARRSQTLCAGPDCERQMRGDGAPLDVCVKCRRTFYCGKECQTADWKREGGRKAECKELIAETAVEAAAAATTK